jgi:hypothetical protein
MKPVQPRESLEELTFPERGLDVSIELESQPAETTPDAVNVRGFEPSTNRQRGAARSGLVKYIDDRVNGLSKIQHLNIIVDPTTDALISDDAEGEISDPSTNNLSVRNPGGRRRLRRGGSGRQPNRKRPKAALTIRADDQTKTTGDTFVFLGTEFTATGLIGGDSVSSATITSAGAPSGATAGAYDISISNAVGSGLNKYQIIYQLGSMTVSDPPVTIEYIFMLSAMVLNSAGGAATAELLLDGVSIISLSPTRTPSFNAAFWHYETRLTGGVYPLTFSPVPDVIAGGGVFDGDTPIARPAAGPHVIAIKVTWTDDGVNSVGVILDAGVYQVDAMTLDASLLRARSLTNTLALGGGNTTGGSGSFNTV